MPAVFEDILNATAPSLTTYALISESLFSTAFLIASGTSSAFPVPNPTKPLPSPQATNANKETNKYENQLLKAP